MKYFTIWFVAALALCSGFNHASATPEIEALVDDYLRGTGEASAAAASQLTMFPFAEVHSVLAASAKPESREFLNAVRLCAQFDDPEALPVLVGFLIEYSDADWMRREPYRAFVQELRLSVIRAIVPYGFDAAAPYLEQADTTDDHYWAAVAQIYSEMDDERAVYPLIELLRDGESYTKRTAASGLIKFDATWAIAELEHAFRAVRDGSSRQSILGVLKELWLPQNALMREFDIVTSPYVRDWYFARVLWQKHPELPFTDFQISYINNIELVPQIGYAGALYMCNAVTMSDYVSTNFDRNIWTQTQQDWVNANREAIIDELMRPYREREYTAEGPLGIPPSDAQILAYLRVDEAFSWMRDSYLYSSGNHFTGEGGYPFSHFEAQWFPYHDVLRGAIEYLTAKSLSEAIVLTSDELDGLIVNGQFASFGDTRLYRLYCLQPELATQEAFRLFRESGPQHDINLSITVAQILQASEYSKRDVGEILDQPSHMRDSDWFYEFAGLQNPSYMYGGLMRLSFVDGRLSKIIMLKKRRDGSYEEWEPLPKIFVP